MTKPRMVKPTLAELEAYAEHLGYRDFDAEEFFDHYEANGWMVGRVQMKDWKATVRNWRRMRREYGYGQRRGREEPSSWKQRQAKINQLNGRKAALMRMPSSAARDRELAQIQAQLHKL